MIKREFFKRPSDERIRLWNTVCSKYRDWQYYVLRFPTGISVPGNSVFSRSSAKDVIEYVGQQTVKGRSLAWPHTPGDPKHNVPVASRSRAALPSNYAT